MLLAVALLLVAISLGAVGQIFLKGGIQKLGPHPAPLTVLKSIATPMVAGGFICYGLSSLLYLLAISRLDLSYAYPMVAFSYVMVAILSYWFFHDVPPPMRVAGLAIILIGVMVVALSYKEMSHPAHAAVPSTQGTAQTSK
jgi:drug/metabolite transporter (DMT)-like permease